MSIVIIGVCAFNKFSPKRAVDVFDSSFSGGSLLSLKKQLVVIIKCVFPSFYIRYVEVERQVGTADCGLFAIAFALTLCLGSDPYMKQYNQKLMRNHFEMCVDNKQLLHFPTLPCSRRQRARKRIKCEKELRIFLYMSATMGQGRFF